MTKKILVTGAAVFDQNNIRLSLNISSNSQSSSLLNFGTHKLNYPEILMTNTLPVTTKRIDNLIDRKYTPKFINLDIQGVELKALQGLGVLISEVKYIYTEINRFEVYEQCAKIKDIDKFLQKHGFKRATTRWQWLEGWGDALYVRNDEPKRSLYKILKSFLSLVYFYKPQAKKIVNFLVKHPIFFCQEISKVRSKL